MQLRIICAISFAALMLSQLPAEADDDVKVVCFPVSGNSTTPGTIHGPGGSFKIINIDAFKAAFGDVDMLNLDNDRNKLMLQGLLQDRDLALTNRLSETDVKNAEPLTAIDVKRNNDQLKKIMNDFSGVKGADLVIERSLKNLTSDLKQLENN